MKEVYVKRYLSDDNIEFKTSEECLNHEMIYKNKILLLTIDFELCEDFLEGVDYDAYYILIPTKKDANFMKYISKKVLLKDDIPTQVGVYKFDNNFEHRSNWETIKDDKLINKIKKIGEKYGKTA